MTISYWTLCRYGAQVFVFSRFLPSIVGLLSDPTAPVRDAAFSTLVEIYKYVGERVRVDLQKKYQVLTPSASSTRRASYGKDHRLEGQMMTPCWGDAVLFGVTSSSLIHGLRPYLPFHLVLFNVTWFFERRLLVFSKDIVMISKKINPHCQKQVALNKNSESVGMSRTLEGLFELI